MLLPLLCKAIVHTKRKEKTVELTNGEYTFTVGVGEGVFVIPIH
jgi:hypothetical protein